MLAAGGSAASDTTQEGDWDAGRAGPPGRAGAAGPVPDQLARAVGGLERRPGPDRRRDAGGDPRVRRPPDHRAVLVQGGRPGRDTPLRRRPRAGRPAGRHRRPARPPGRHPERRQARRHHALLLSHQARPGGERGRPGHPGVRRGAAAGHARGRLRPRRRLPRRRRHADPHADRGRRPRHRVAHRRPAPRRPGPGPARRLPPLLRESAERAGLVHPRTLGRPAGWPVHRRELGRHRARLPAVRPRGADDPAAARLRREPGRDLPRSRPAAVAPLPGGVPVAGQGFRRRRDRAPGQARDAGVAARQGARPVRRVRAGRGARRPAGGVPVHRQRPGGGHAGQAARARGDRRPPGAADGAGRHLRRDGQAGAAARRVRHRGRARPGQAARPAARRSGP